MVDHGPYYGHIKIYTKVIKWGASSRGSFIPNSAWGSIETVGREEAPHFNMGYPNIFYSEKFKELQCILLCSILFLSYWNVYLL